VVAVDGRPEAAAQPRPPDDFSAIGAVFPIDVTKWAQLNGKQPI